MYVSSSVVFSWCHFEIGSFGSFSSPCMVVVVTICWWCSWNLVLGRMESDRKHVLQIPNLYFSMYLLRIWQRKNFWNDFCPPLGPSLSPPTHTHSVSFSTISRRLLFPRRPPFPQPFHVHCLLCGCYCFSVRKRLTVKCHDKRFIFSTFANIMLCIVDVPFLFKLNWKSKSNWECGVC